MFTFVSHTSFRYVRHLSLLFHAQKTHSPTFFNVVRDWRDIDRRAQVLPRFQVARRPEDEIELIHHGVVEIHAGHRH